MRRRSHHQPWWVALTAGLVLMAVGAGLMAAGSADRAEHRVLAERGVAVEATATSVREQGRHREITLSWTTTGGRPVVVIGATVDGQVVEGQRVPVVYDPQDPEVFVVAPLGSGYLATLGLGVALVLGGGVAVLRGVWARRSEAGRAG